MREFSNSAKLGPKHMHLYRTDHLHVVVGVSTARAGRQESGVAASVCACCAAVCEAQDSRRFTFIESGVVP